jgi:hypothetical protein
MSRVPKQYHSQNKNEQMSKFTLITIFALVFILHLYEDKMYNVKYHLPYGLFRLLFKPE